MKARLNLTIDERLLLDVKKIAAKNGTSLSELVTDYFHYCPTKRGFRSLISLKPS